MIGFAIALLVGIPPRLWTASLGYNFDVESWWLAARIIDAGLNVWVDTFRIPYGPVWPGISWLALRATRLVAPDSIQNLHLVLAGVLTAVDVALALLLRTIFGWVPASLIFLCPISILITGFHSQIDSLAILLALASWVVWRRAGSDPAFSRIAAAAVLLGLSLATKHVFAFFPLCVLAGRQGVLGKRALYAGGAYFVFVASFVPFALKPGNLDGIIDNVFAYRGIVWYGNALLPRLVPWPGAWQPLFFGGLVAFGLWAGRTRRHDPFFLYPAALVLLSPVMADQYLVLPLVSLAAYWRSPALWLFVVVGTVALLGSTNNVGSLPELQSFSEAAKRLGLVIEPSTRSTLLPQLSIALFFASLPWTRPVRRLA